MTTSSKTVILGLGAFFVLCPFSDADNIYLSDHGAGAIYKFNSSGQRSTFASGLSGPDGLAVDNSGNIFLADHGAGAVYEFNPSGQRSTFASGLSGPTFIAAEVVPEPATLAVMAFGLGTSLGFRRLRSK